MARRSSRLGPAEVDEDYTPSQTGGDSGPCDKRFGVQFVASSHGTVYLSLEHNGIARASKPPTIALNNENGSVCFQPKQEKKRRDILKKIHDMLQHTVYM